MNRIFQQSGSGASLADLGHPATHVDIHQICAHFLRQSGGLRHDFRIAAKDLNAQRTLLVQNLHLAKRLLRSVVDRHGTHKLGKHEAGSADPLGNKAKREVGYILHGR